MACGCKKKKPKPVAATPSAEVAAYFSTNRAMLPESDEVVQARCANCVGLLRTYDGKYLPMHTGDFYAVLRSDVSRWRSQGWVIEIR